MSQTPRIPSYRLHKATGQAVVTLSGRDVYLGQHGTPESRRMYEQKLAEWLASGRSTPMERAPDLTVSEIVSAYSAHAAVYYGGNTSQTHRIDRALGFVRDLYGPIPAAKFGPLALSAVRQRMVSAGFCRRHVNHQIGCVKRCFVWAVGRELLPASVAHGLATVEGLRYGRTEARESEPVRPVPEQDIDAVRPFLLLVLRDVIDLQLLTAMRPGEALALRPCDLDRAGSVWLYRPEQHKTKHRGHQRAVFIGPRAQAVLSRYLLRPMGTCCFSPREAVEARYRELGRAIRHGKSRVPGDRYKPTSYSHAVRQACIRAGVTPTWHPHALRHNAATRLASEFGIELARVILGHRSLSVTEVYAEIDARKAMEVMRRIG